MSRSRRDDVGAGATCASATLRESAVEAELKRRGLNSKPDMVGENFKSFHLTDPDGWDLQITNQTKGSRGGGGA
jgi:hypothetical protein